MKSRFFVLVFLIAISKTYGSDADTAKYPQLNKTYLKSYLSDSKAFLVSPAGWGHKQWLECGIVAGVATLAYSQDENIQQYLISHRSQTADQFSKYVFEPFGNGKVTSILIGGLYLGGLIAKDKRLAGTSLTAAKAFVVSSVCSQVIKQLAHRHRPFQDMVPDHSNWDGPLSETRFASFPSGHSTAAFSLATVFAMEYRETIWVPVLAYTLASGTAVSRLYDNKHWISDVVVGSALGFVTGRFMWKQNKKNANQFIVMPWVSHNKAVLSFIIALGEPKRQRVVPK